MPGRSISEIQQIVHSEEDHDDNLTGTTVNAMENVCDDDTERLFQTSAIQ